MQQKKPRGIMKPIKVSNFTVNTLYANEVNAIIQEVINRYPHKAPIAPLYVTGYKECLTEVPKGPFNIWAYFDYYESSMRDEDPFGSGIELYGADHYDPHDKEIYDGWCEHWWQILNPMYPDTEYSKAWFWHLMDLAQYEGILIAEHDLFNTVLRIERSY